MKAIKPNLPHQGVWQTLQKKGKAEAIADLWHNRGQERGRLQVCAVRRASHQPEGLLAVQVNLKSRSKAFWMT